MIQSKLETLIEPILAELGCTLWGSDYQTQGKQAVLRLYVDKPGGVTLSDCTDISRRVGALLDVEAPRLGRYTLEVSSPGLPRPLFKPSQYHAYVGREVFLKMNRLVDGTRKITGRIELVNDDGLTVLVGERTLMVPFSQITKAHLIDG